MDRTGRWGRAKSNYHKERGRETPWREGKRVREIGLGGDEINLLIFHGQPVVITMFSALRAFGVGQFKCVHICV